LDKKEACGVASFELRSRRQYSGAIPLQKGGKPIRPQKIEKKSIGGGRIHKNVKNCGKDRIRTLHMRLRMDSTHH